MRDTEYDAFVAGQVKYCSCDPPYCPCAGVLAGGMCNELKSDEDELLYGDNDDWDEDY